MLGSTGQRRVLRDCASLTADINPAVLQARWYSFHFLVQQYVASLGRLRTTLNLLAPQLPGACIPAAAAYVAQATADVEARSASEAGMQAALLAEAAQRKGAAHVVTEGAVA